MMYQGIIISGTDMTECYEIAKNLELSQSYKIVRVVSNSKKKECYHYIEDDKLARIDKECFLIKIEFDGVFEFCSSKILKNPCLASLTSPF